MRSIPAVIRQFFLNDRLRVAVPAMIEPLEGRRLLSGSIVSTTATPIAPATAHIAVSTVIPVGVTIHADAGFQFTAVVGKVDGLSAAVLANYKNLQAKISWNTPSTATPSNGVISVAGNVLVVKGTHTYANAGSHAITVTVETIPPVLDPPPPTAKNVTAAPIVLATIHSVADVSNNTPSGVTLTEHAKTAFTATLGSFVFKGDNYSLSANITWGDGSHSAGKIVADASDTGHWTVRGTHTYAKIGSYAVSIIVTATPVPTKGGVSMPIILVVANIRSTINVLGPIVTPAT